jgi:hypothetical protein
VARVPAPWGPLGEAQWAEVQLQVRLPQVQLRVRLPPGRTVAWVKQPVR